MEHHAQALNAVLDHANRYESPLQRIANRIHGLAQGAAEIAAKLRDHADAVHGEQAASSNGKDGPRPCRSGQLGNVEDALDDLERALSMVSEQSGRNCSLGG